MSMRDFLESPVGEWLTVTLMAGTGFLVLKAIFAGTMLKKLPLIPQLIAAF